MHERISNFLARPRLTDTWPLCQGSRSTRRELVGIIYKTIVRLDKCSLASIQMRTRHENLCNFSLKCFSRPMTNHSDYRSKNELVRTHLQNPLTVRLTVTISIPLRRNTSIFYFGQSIIASTRKRRKSIDASLLLQLCRQSNLSLFLSLSRKRNRYRDDEKK